MPYLALVLFLPWFLLLGTLFWAYPRQPRHRQRRLFDAASLLLAFGLSMAGMHFGYVVATADASAGAIWKQVLATLAGYGAFLAVLVLAVLLRLRLLPAR